VRRAAERSRCRYDTDASGTCWYKTEPEATVSAGGFVGNYYHLLIDFATRVLFAMSRDGCKSATLHVPGYYPHYKPFRLVSKRDHAGRHGWDAVSNWSAYGYRARERGSQLALGATATSAQTVAAALFGPHTGHSLDVRFVPSSDALCEHPGKLVALFTRDAQSHISLHLAQYCAHRVSHATSDISHFGRIPYRYHVPS
jgi:hypothetical protein